MEKRRVATERRINLEERRGPYWKSCHGRQMAGGRIYRSRFTSLMIRIGGTETVQSAAAGGWSKQPPFARMESRRVRFISLRTGSCPRVIVKHVIRCLILAPDDKVPIPLPWVSPYHAWIVTVYICGDSILSFGHEHLNPTLSLPPPCSVWATQTSHARLDSDYERHLYRDMLPSATSLQTLYQMPFLHEECVCC
jgi:hypothetical protein